MIREQRHAGRIMARLNLGRAIAVDGKRIRGANRNGAGHHETATLVDHATRAPLASLAFNEEGGEVAAVHALLERVPVDGRVITLDALTATRKTARLIKDTHGADYLVTVKGNAPETRDILASINREEDGSGHFTEDIDKAHGRIGQRRIATLTPHPRLINHPTSTGSSGSPASAPTRAATAPERPPSSTPAASPRHRRSAPPRRISLPGTADTGRSRPTTTSGTRSSARTRASRGPGSRPRTTRPPPTSRSRSSSTRPAPPASPRRPGASRSGAGTPWPRSCPPERRGTAPQRRRSAGGGIRRLRTPIPPRKKAANPRNGPSRVGRDARNRPNAARTDRNRRGWDAPGPRERSA